jgi:hypothetical protein
MNKKRAPWKPRESKEMGAWRRALTLRTPYEKRSNISNMLILKNQWGRAVLTPP